MISRADINSSMSTGIALTIAISCCIASGSASGSGPLDSPNASSCCADEEKPAVSIKIWRTSSYLVTTQ